MSAAMQMVREAIGDDAIILSTSEEGGGQGVCVTAALEDDEDEIFPGSASPSMAHDADIREEAPHAALVNLLAFHACPPELAAVLLDEARRVPASTPPRRQVEAMLAGFYRFAPIAPDVSQPPLMLIGGPGAGKTVTTAKIAAEAVIHGMPVCVISTDTSRAGGIAQLEAYCDVLDLPLHAAVSGEELRLLLDRHAGSHYVVIDTAGVSAYETAALRELGALISCFELEPVLVQPAGMDVSEAVEAAASFVYLGAERLIVTKIDAVRRHGSILAVAESGNLTLANVSAHAGAAEGLEPLSPELLAELLLRNVR